MCRCSQALLDRLGKEEVGWSACIIQELYSYC